MKTGMPWKITKREKVWTSCFNWLQRQNGIQILEVSARYNKVRFFKNFVWWKCYLPYEDTKLQTVLLNEISCRWSEIFSLKEFKERLNKQKEE